MPTQDELARQLIDLVRETTAPEAVLLQRRIDATLSYLTDVTNPNMIMVKNVRTFLTGGRDDALEFWIEAFNETQGDLCDECGMRIPDVAAGSATNRHHATSCSLYDATQE